MKEQPVRPPVGPKINALLFSRTRQNHTVMVSLHCLYDAIIGLFYSFFKGVLWNHQEQQSVPKMSNDWEILSFASEKSNPVLFRTSLADQGNTESSASLLRFRSTLGPLASASG